MGKPADQEQQPEVTIAADKAATTVATQRKPPRRVELGVLAGRNPRELVRNAEKLASVLRDVIDKQGMVEIIGGNPYVKVEGWTTCATLLGVFPQEVPEFSHWFEVDGVDVYEACVDLISMKTDQRIARATAECGAADETHLDKRSGKQVPTWAQRPRYAKRSMAITRATSKACRLAFSWIIKLAGYEETPAEEFAGIYAGPRSIYGPDDYLPIGKYKKDGETPRVLRDCPAPYLAALATKFDEKHIHVDVVAACHAEMYRRAQESPEEFSQDPADYKTKDFDDEVPME